MGVMRTNWKNFQLSASMNGKKRYNITENSDGTVCIDDVTDYKVIGDSFGADELNLIARDMNSNVQEAESYALESERFSGKAFDYSTDAADSLAQAEEQADLARGYAEEAKSYTPEGYSDIRDKVNEIYYITLTKTLTAGSSSLVFQDARIVDGSTISVSASVSNMLMYADRTLSEAGKITLFFKPKSQDVIVKVRLS